MACISKKLAKSCCLIRPRSAGPETIGMYYNDLQSNTTLLTKVQKGATHFYHNFGRYGLPFEDELRNYK